MLTQSDYHRTNTETVILTLSVQDIKIILRSLDFTRHVEKYLVQDVIGKINRQTEDINY